MRAAMRKAWLLILCLITSSLVLTTTVHAREWVSNATIECSGSVHTDGDKDQTQGDADKGVPHHHGTCHGQVAPAPTASALNYHASTTAAFAGSTSAALNARTIDPALRPPIA